MLSPNIETGLLEQQDALFTTEGLNDYKKGITELFRLEYPIIIDKSGEFRNFLEVSERLARLNKRTQLLLRLRDQTVKVLHATRILPGPNEITASHEPDYFKLIVTHDPDLSSLPLSQNITPLSDLLSYVLIMRNTARYRFEFSKGYSQNGIAAFGDLSYWEKKLDEIIANYPQIFTIPAQKTLRLLCLNNLNIEASTILPKKLSRPAGEVENSIQSTPAPSIIETEKSSLPAQTVGREANKPGISTARPTGPIKASIDSILEEIDLSFAPTDPFGSYRETLLHGVVEPEHEDGTLDRFFRKKGIDPKSVSYHIKIAVEKPHGDRLVEDQYLTFHSETELRDYLSQADTKSIKDFDITWRENGNQRQAYSYFNNREEYAKQGYTAEFGRGLIDLWRLIYKENYINELRRKFFTLNKIRDLLTQIVPLEQIFDESPRTQPAQNKKSPLANLLEGIKKNATSKNKPAY